MEEYSVDTACRDRFTFHRCHLPASIILVNAVVGRRRCPGRDPPPRRDRESWQRARIERANDDREISVGGTHRPRMHVDHQRPTFSPPNFEVITKRPCCRPVLRPYCRLLFLFLSLFALSMLPPRLSITSSSWSSFSRPRATLPSPSSSSRQPAKINAT